MTSGYNGKRKDIVRMYTHIKQLIVFVMHDQLRSVGSVLCRVDSISSCSRLRTATQDLAIVFGVCRYVQGV